MGEMISEIVTITPEIAREYLTHNMQSNRPVLAKTVQGYARTMKAGGWGLTHQGIAFDEEGTLIDGQHRLNAIIQANVPVKMLVTRGVQHKKGDALSIDIGRKRTYANIMQISGIDDPVYRGMGSTVTSYIRWKLPSHRNADPVEVSSYIERHYDDIKALSEIVLRGGSGSRRDGNYKIPAFVSAAMLGAMYRGEDRDALEAFAKVYRLNDVNGCENYNPKHALNLREWMRNARYTQELYSKAECAIWCFCHNRASMHLRDNCYPYIGYIDD